MSMKIIIACALLLQNLNGILKMGTYHKDFDSIQIGNVAG